MKSESIVLLTKDALCADYLPSYGNRYWAGKTPNMDELAAKGTVFTRYYTAAPSSAMAYLSMFTGKYPYEQEIKDWKPVLGPYKGTTLFDKAYEMGYDCHILWDEKWKQDAYRYSECYGEHTTFHDMKEIRQGVGSHYIHEGFLTPDEEKSRKTLGRIESEIAQIAKNEDKVFLWIHMPHVINGRVCYGSDIDLFDEVLGILRKYFDDSHISVSADHGNMNGHRGKLCYGFDVYEPAIRIPLITPRKEGKAICDDLTCNVDLYQLLFEDAIPVRDVVYADSAYYAQTNRNLAVLLGKYRYIYHKKTGMEELFDIHWDPGQEFNLFSDWNYDTDRHVQTPSRELYFYPEWEKLPQVRQRLQALKNEIWKDETVKQRLYFTAKNAALRVYRKVKKTRIKQ